VSNTENLTRGRKRAFDKEAAAALAMPHFAREGYDSTSVADLCALLDLRPPSLYAAWGSKLGLFRAALDAYRRGPGNLVGPVLAQATCPADLWHKVLAAAASRYARPGTPGCMILNGEVATSDAEARAVLRETVAAITDALAVRLATLGDPAPHAEARTLVAMMRALSLAARAGATAEDLDRMRAIMVAGYGHVARR
jgi:TetR/AcrR family transcriptional repressor for divergent bdcA